MVLGLIIGFVIGVGLSALMVRTALKRMGDYSSFDDFSDESRDDRLEMERSYGPNDK